MNIDPELILAIVAVIGAIVSALQARAAAKRDVVSLLQAEVDRDHKRLAKLEQERNVLADTRSALEQERNGLKTAVQELQQRVTEAEKRLSQSEQRAGIAERTANEFRQDVIQLGERIRSERTDSQTKINKLVVIIQQLLQKMQAAGINPEPEVNMDLLQQLIVIEKSPG